MQLSTPCFFINAPPPPPPMVFKIVIRKLDKASIHITSYSHRVWSNYCLIMAWLEHSVLISPSWYLSLLLSLISAEWVASQLIIFGFYFAYSRFYFFQSHASQVFSPQVFSDTYSDQWSGDDHRTDTDGVSTICNNKNGDEDF